MRRRGFTLSELLVYIGVLSVFTTALYSLIVLSVRHCRISETRSDTMQTNLKAVMRVNKELVAGANGTLQVQITPPAMMFLSAQPPASKTFAVDSGGQLLWQKWVCIRYDAANRKILSSVKSITPTPTPPTSPTFAVMTALPAQVLARDITTFSLTQLDSKTVSYTVGSAVNPGSVGANIARKPEQKRPFSGSRTIPLTAGPSPAA